MSPVDKQKAVQDFIRTASTFMEKAVAEALVQSQAEAARWEQDAIEARLELHLLKQKKYG